MRIYISGPIAHYDIIERKARFERAEEAILASGNIAVNPFENGVPDDADWRDHMKADIKMLLECDAVYMLEGWEGSKGCKLELDVATSCGIPVFYHNLCWHDGKVGSEETNDFTYIRWQDIKMAICI